MTHDKIDFSSLDPARDRARWERLTQKTQTRARLARSQSDPLLRQLYAWSAPALGIAAGFALAIWGIASLGSSTSSPSVSYSDPVVALSSWAEQGQIPSQVDIAGVLGQNHESQ